MARGRLNSGNAAEQELPKAKINRRSLHNIKQLFNYLKPYRLKFAGAMFFLFLSSLTGLAFPKLVGGLVDAASHSLKQGLLPGNLNDIGLIALAVLFAQGFVSFFRVTWFVQIAENALADIRRDTYFKLITLPMDFFANRRVGELNSRISSDLSQIQDTITTNFAEIIRQITLMIGGIILMAMVSGKLALVILVILPLLIPSAILFARYTRKISRAAQDELAASNTIVQETLLGIASVKAFVNEAFEAARYDKSIRNVARLGIKGATVRGLFAAFVVFIGFGVIFCMVWYGAHLVLIKDLKFGELIQFVIYAMMVSTSLASLPEQYANIQRTVGASERVIEILNDKGESVNIIESENRIKQKIEGNLSFNNVQFHYPSRPEIEVLKGVSFDATAGQKVAIVGPSGSGKSTTASLILQFYHPQNGELLFDGKPASAYSLTDIRKQVAIVPQDVILFGGTIRENIAYGKLGATDEEIEQAAKRANAYDFITGFPEGFSTVVGERGVKLSGGQRQRIAIARALLKNPSILILDEATSSLDSESERLVQEALEELMKGRTSIIIAHRLSTIREADQIIVLEKGVIVESGNHDELLQNESGLYRYLSSLQFEV
ncbi:multidrug ABC transporter ATP-binding protein [Mucilaginibacter sp. PPCGB 2223]|uniref:ABC transporter ATP-binding protein n=1 Tax=Mucilaginibacter sp. PPCGB 2223 TaxID=1886027 RepID=UPI0008265020|nr:ABC transporter transmembrane domain-containing protein [Mucilaginibacter sp. PPCGB 2223]OCX53481.1 multidrug ABC transporter ATP-binding protein [Mucilaginibacter sp. PPCGB 2223]